MHERSPKFDRVQGYYAAGFWTADMVRNAVGKWITEAEAVEILGGPAGE